MEVVGWMEYMLPQLGRKRVAAKWNELPFTAVNHLFHILNNMGLTTLFLLPKQPEL